jgi:predicted ATPase with chaperone activity
VTSSVPLGLVSQHLLILYHGNWESGELVVPKEGSLSDVVGKSTRRSFHLLVGATLATGLPIVAAFESSKRRLLIVGEPGSGKSMAAYSLIEQESPLREP